MLCNAGYDFTLFTAEINGSGGAALAFDKTILTVQDSQAA